MECAGIIDKRMKGIKSVNECYQNNNELGKCEDVFGQHLICFNLLTKLNYYLFTNERIIMIKYQLSSIPNIYCYYQYIDINKEMNRQYQKYFKTKKVNQEKLRHKIKHIYSHYDLNKHYNYDQLLFIFDEKCKNKKCDRDVCLTLFQQGVNTEGYASINQMIDKYIQNLQISKICLIKDEYKKDELEELYQNCKVRNKTYIHLKIIQVSIYSRFSKTSTFGYKINPSTIPVVTLTNSLNPILNHEYTLEMQNDSFQIIFYESGIEIYKWQFPDKTGLSEGQYLKSVNTQNLSFQIKIKYEPKGQSLEKQQLQNQILQKKSKLINQRQAFHKLCLFQPFLDEAITLKSDYEKPLPKSMWFNLTEELFDFIPFFRNHIINLQYILIIWILCESLASYYWPMDLIDLLVGFYLMGILYDRNIINVGFKFMIIQLIICICIIKSIWGIYQQPEVTKTQHYTFFILLGIVEKILIILCLFVSVIRKEQILIQRQNLYPSSKQKVPELFDEQINQDIFED